MIGARIVPYMSRNTFAEWARRRRLLLDCWWHAALTPARCFFGMWR